MSEALEECEEPVVGSVPPGLAIGRCGQIQNPLFQFKVGIQVDLHELVHHVQTVTEMEYPCLAAREPLAYGLQAQWLQENGVEDPYAMMGVDKFTLLIRSTCWPVE